MALPKLNFTDTLPEGAVIVDNTVRSTRGVNKDAVERELRSHPNQWTLVYPETTWHVITEWRKRKQGRFQVAHEPLPDQPEVQTSQKRFKVWLKYVPVEGDEHEPQASQSLVETGLVYTDQPGVHTDPPASPAPAIDAEPVPGPVPALTPPPPVPSVPEVSGNVIKPPPETAFQKAWAGGEPQLETQEILP